VVLEVLRWAASYGADIANYVEVTGLSAKANDVRGVIARDTLDGSEYSFRAPVVVNSAGPWSSKLAETLGGKIKKWFWPSMAWNLLTDKPAPSGHALAITPPRKSGPTYFLHPWKGRLLIGTGHVACPVLTNRPEIPDDKIQIMIDDVNSSIPGLGLGTENIDRVFAGFLPAAGELSAELSKRPVIYDHAESGGPRGLVSICGVKFTTARRVAQETLDSVFGKHRILGIMEYRRPDPAQGWQSGHVDFSDDVAVGRYLLGIAKLVDDESATNIRDVVIRRTDLWERPELAADIAPKICELFDWPEEKRLAELAKLAQELARPV
jgi:glycerol-3-phosphate dehydrogenase